MELNIIVAAAENNVIGANNDLIWHLPADLQYFKKTTSGHPIIMGRKTFDSIGRPLPKRRNIVVSRSTELVIEGCEVVGSIQEAIELCRNESKCFIIGGGSIYKESLPMTDKVYLTRIHNTYEGDTVFPELKEKDWELVEKTKGTLDDKNKIPHTFFIYQRKRA